MTTGTAAFASAEQGRDIQESLIEYVATFVGNQSGSNFSPHVTMGVGTLAYLEEMLAEPFEAFSSHQRQLRSTSSAPLARHRSY